jgi:hypothetical protein
VQTSGSSRGKKKRKRRDKSLESGEKSSKHIQVEKENSIAEEEIGLQENDPTNATNFKVEEPSSPIVPESKHKKKHKKKKEKR